MALVCAGGIWLATSAGRDRAPAVARADPYRVEVVETNGDLTQHLTRLHDLEFGPARTEHGPAILVAPSRRFQSIDGFGGAMTDSSAWLLERVARPAARRAAMDALFAGAGIRLNFIRVPIGASDFTRDGRPYSYDDLPPGRTDPGLRHFSIAHDEAYVLPSLRQALALAPGVEFLASPWSAPGWMKQNDALDNIHDGGILLPAAYRTWAAYIVRFLTAYARAGVPIHAITPQNEPGNPTSYPGMAFPARAESAWVAADLAPALDRAHEHPEIIAGDKGWGPNSLPYFRAALGGAGGRDFRGAAWHCYFGQPGVMATLRAAFPRQKEILDECSPGGITPTPTAEIAIGSLRNWASAVVMWNLVLDPSGGPVQPPNHGCPGCIGLMTIDRRGANATPTRSFYELGQISAFVARGARRIASNHFVAYAYPHRGVNVVTPGLDDVAVRNPDGSLVLVAYDNSARPVRFAVRWRGRGLSYTLSPRATVTFVWNRVR